MSNVISHVLDTFADVHAEGRAFFPLFDALLDSWLRAKYIENDLQEIDEIWYTIVHRCRTLRDDIDRLEVSFRGQERLKDAFKFLEDEYGTVTIEVLVKGFGEDGVGNFSNRPGLLQVVENLEVSRKKLELLEGRWGRVDDHLAKKLRCPEEIPYFEIGEMVMNCFEVMMKAEKANKKVFELEVENREKMIELYFADEARKAEELIEGLVGL